MSMIKFIAACILSLLSLFKPNINAAEQLTRMVSIAPLSETIIFPKRSAPATTVSLNESRISAELNARIVIYPVQVGDIVKKGQTLVELDCEDYYLQQQQSEAAVKTAVAQLKLAKRQLTRARSLVSDSNVSRELLNQRETELASANASLTSAEAQQARDQLNVRRCKIPAPFGGIVLEKLASVGEWVNIGTPVARLLDNQRLEVAAEVPTYLISSLEQANDIWFEGDNLRYPLTMRVIVPAVNTRARNREVRLLFTDDKALPGAAGRLVWQSALPHVPSNLIVRREDRLGIFLANESHARFIPLDDAREGQPAPIRMPLTGNVVIKGRHGLRNGDILSIQ